MHQALKYNNTQENQRKYEEFLLQNGAKDEFFKRIKNGKGSGDWKQLANGYFYSQDWENVIRVLKKHISQDNTKYFYTYLKYAVAVSKIKGNQAGKKILQNLPTDIQSNPWIDLLTKYYLDQLKDKELLAQADNACKKTEAYFWIGVRQIGYDNQKAKQNFQNVLKEKVYSYIEYAISSYYLKEGIK
jgi:lipoprotein NlpI